MLVPCHQSVSARGILDIYTEVVFRKGFVPSRLITDSDNRLMGAEAQTFHSRLGTALTRSLPYHHQANPVERYVQTAESCLRKVCVRDVSAWDQYLAEVELALNSTPSSITAVAPLDLLYRSWRPRALSPELSDKVWTGSQPWYVRLGQREASLRRGALPTLKEGDSVYLKLRDRPVNAISSPKLSYRNAGAYRVTETLSNHRLRLELPAILGTQPICDVSQALPAADGALVVEQIQWNHGWSTASRANVGVATASTTWSPFGIASSMSG